MGGLWEGENRRNIKYARTDAWSHSSLPFLPVSLFPILVPSKRFPPLPVFLLLQSPPLSSRSLFLSLCSATYALGAVSFLSCISRANLPREALSIGRFFFLFLA